ncbi:MAG: 3'-5' exonuclease [Bacteroidota bacterium]
MLDTLLLQRPLVFFDLETTGSNPVKDKIVELCAIKILPDPKVASHTSRITYVQLFNPEMKIPYEASQIHGITNEMVKHKPPFRLKANEIADFFNGCDVAGFNIARFDVPLLVEEFLRSGLLYNPLEHAKIIDAMSIFHKKEPRNLEAALKFYANEILDNAHSAEADVEAAMKVLDGQLKKYSDLIPTTEALQEFTASKFSTLDYDGKFARDKSGEIIFNFGSNKGKRVADNSGMVQWMLDKDFSEHTKFIARKILKGEIV